MNNLQKKVIIERIQSNNHELIRLRDHRDNFEIEIRKIKEKIRAYLLENLELEKELE